MTYAFFSLADQFIRLRARHTAPIEKRTRAIGIARIDPVLRGTRTNPEIRDTEYSTNMLGRLSSALRNRRIQRRWQRDLRRLDDRLLRDIGVSRADAEQATQRLQIWI